MPVPPHSVPTNIELRFSITFRRGAATVAIIEGQRAVSLEDLTNDELLVKTTETEVFLEKLTGLRVRIDQVD